MDENVITIAIIFFFCGGLALGYFLRSWEYKDAIKNDIRTQENVRKALKEFYNIKDV